MMTQHYYYYYHYHYYNSNYYYHHLSWILFSWTVVVGVYGRVGDSVYTGTSTAIDNNDTSSSSSSSSCGIVYSTSLIDPNRYALYVTKEYNRTGIILSDQELVVPIVNANKNEYSPWHDFVWKDDWIPARMRNWKYQQPPPYSIFTREYFIAGIAAIAPCTSNFNVQPNYDQLTYGSLSHNNNNNPALIDPESVSDYHNFIIQTTSEPLQPAGRMLVNECGPDDTHVPERAATTTTLVHPRIDDDGICMDTLHVRSSTIPGIGRGAFAKYYVARGHVVATSPLLHFDRSQMNIVPQSIMIEHNHTVPLYRAHNMEYRASQTRVGQQLLLNYCFGHPDSNLLLLPYGPGVNFINHPPSSSPDHQAANVMIRWSQHPLAASSTSFRTETPVLEMLEQPAGTVTTNLLVEYVALRDILPGEEIFLHYGDDFRTAWEEHVVQLASSSSSSPPHEPFRHEIGVPDGWYPDPWMRADPNPTGDFIASPLVPGHVAPIRWKGTAEIVTPWAFRVGLPRRVRKVLLQYCNTMGITDILRHVTVDGNGLEPGTETHMELEGDDWYLQRPDANWRSNLHWFSPGAAPAHEHYLQALGLAGFDKVLQGVGEYLGMDGLVAFHVTFIAGSYSNRGFLHRDVSDTNAKVYNIIIPLLLANETGPELDLQSWNPGRPEEEQDFRVGRYRYEYDVGSMMGDNAIHATSACDYRYRNEMRMAATVYVADVNDMNAANVLNHYTQAYPPRDLDLLKSWSGRHWKRNDPSRTLPKPALDHILVHGDDHQHGGDHHIWKASPSRGRVLLPPPSSQNAPNALDDEPVVDEL